MTNDSGNNSPQAEGKRKRVIIILAAMILAVAGAGGTFLLLGGSERAAVTEEVIEEDQSVIYISLDKPFIFNVAGDKRQRLVQVTVQLMVRGAANEALAREHLPLVEHSLLSAFSAATVEQLRTSRGQLEIRNLAANAVKKSMEKVTGTPVVERVLFTGFVMQ